MAVTTYTELKTALENWLHRDDLTTIIPDFIVNAEARLNRHLRVRQMESVTTDTIASNTITLPSDWLGFRDVYIVGSPNQALTYLTPDQQRIQDASETKKPEGFSIQGSKVYFFPVADSAYTVGYTYYQKIPDLATNTTNWLLTAHPDLYIAACLFEAYQYTRDKDAMAQWLTNMKSTIQEVKELDLERWSGPLEMKRG